jgi:glycosyltransferase involved in cell wall biosynthesis
MKIAILGTRGIPNNYGGFEQFAEYLALGLVQKGHRVTVYNSHTHPYKESTWKGVTIKHIYDPENKIGTAGQFIYDFLSILDTRKKDFDIILELGYTSSSVFFDFHPKKSIIVTNMDGLEWKRTKFSAKVQKFLQWAESLAVKKSNHLVSDSIGIQNYLKKKYDAGSTYIPYGSHLFSNEDMSMLDEYNIEPYKYNMLIARLEPENSIEIILDGVVKANNNVPFLVIGKHETKFGEYLKDKFSDHTNIRFVGGVYDIDVLNNLRHFSNLYFHGHTVGGTNPSLLEAMASSALICANDNEFNSTILGEDAFYFTNTDDVATFLTSVAHNEQNEKIKNNRVKITELYTWEKIVDDYEKLFLDLLHDLKQNKV